jgi:FkbM family methyltransferase
MQLCGFVPLRIMLRGLGSAQQCLTSEDSAVKRLILGTPLGRIAHSMRDRLGVVRAVHEHPELAGAIANDYIAGVLVTRICQDNKTFIDIGAHIGSIIDGVIHHCPLVGVIAVEPMPDKVAHLRQKFPAVELHECALSDSEGEAVFYVNTKRSGYSSLGRGVDPHKAKLIEIKVQVKILDNLISVENLDVMKIDVVGAELGVLRGSERLVATNRPTIVFESGLRRDDGLGYTKEAIWQWFAERDYTMLVPNRVAHNDPGLSLDGFVESHLYPRRTTNYFAVPKERRVEIRDRSRAVLKLPGI